jgi:3-oxoacyl-[acyl-carrier protein] reductase
MDLLLTGKVALVTGGARGIGRGIALTLAGEGAKVAIDFANRADAASEVVRKIEAGGGEAVAFQADVGRSAEVDRMVGDVLKRFGRIDILVNNAGMTIPKPFMERTAEDWIRTLEVNLIGVFLCSQAAAKHMLAQKSGTIVNVSSIRGVGHCGREGVMDYSAAKSGVISLTKTMAKELAPHITVNTVAPGHTVTEMTATLPDAVKKNMIEGSYLKRMARTEDIAKAIMFLASDDASFITGQMILVDGGFSLKAG